MKHVIVGLAVVSSILAHNYHGVALAPDNVSGWVVCLDTVLIFHTTDGCVTWQQQSPPENVERFFDITCIDELQAWTIGDVGQVLHTNNGGIDWYIQWPGFSKYGTRIEFIDDNYGWAACGDGTVGRTTSGGSSWETNFTPWYAAEFYGVSFVNQWDGWLVAGYPDSLLTEQGLILNSTDGGINWNLLYESPTYEDFFDVHFFHLYDGIVVGGDETDYSPLILRTTNGGIDWDTMSAPASSYYLRAVDFVGNKGWAVGRFGTIIHTDDGGNTWSFQNNPAVNTLFDVDFSDTLHGLACGDGIILRTTDGGQNWYETGIHEYENESPQQVTLHVHPNPFSGLINIRHGIQDAGYGIQDISLYIYDITGQLVKSFGPLPYAPGPMQVSWDGTDEGGNEVSAGVYIISLESEKFNATKKVTVLK